MRRRVLFAMVCLLGLAGGGVSAPPAVACPMCEVANESDAEANRPQAYMYSILFMLAMPATLLTAFGVGFYRLSRQPFPPDEIDGPDEPSA